jgi:hypothetical protein
VVDGGCPKTVTGKPWMDAYIESMGDVVVKRRREKEFFKFGPSQLLKCIKIFVISLKSNF